MIKPQAEFPLIETYKKHFPIHDKVIFAYGDTIYSNYPLTEDLLIHEKCHLEQQKRIGIDTWVEQYLNDAEFRAKMEQEAYRKQLESINDREKKFKVKQEILKQISTGLYGDANIII